MRQLMGLVVSLATVLCAFPAHALTGAELVEKVQEKFGGLKTLSADFEKTFEWKLAGEVHESKGKLYIERPDKFRIETDGWVMCSDGVSVWAYSEANEQVLVSDASDSAEALTPQALLFQYAEHFDAEYKKREKLGRRTCYVVELTPKQKGAFVTQMVVWVDKGNGLTRKVSYSDINGNVTTYQLSHVQTDKRLDSALCDALSRFS